MNTITDPKLSEKLKGRYSEKFQQLIEIIHNEAGYDCAPVDDKVDIVDFMVDYEYPISSCPVIISNKVLKQFNEIIEPLVNLFYKSIKIYFKKDQNLFSEYLNEQPILLELINSIEVDPRSLIIRHDLVFSGDDLKIIEANIGSNLGGWQLDWFSKKFDEKLKESKLTSEWDLNYRNITESFFKAISNNIRRNSPNAKQTVLFYMQGIESVKEQPGFCHIQEKILKKVSGSEHASIVFFEDFNKITFQADGSVKFFDKTIDAIVLSLPEDIDAPPITKMRLVSSAIAGKIVYPDNPLLAIIGNKIIFSLLYEKELHEQLNKNEIDYIYKHIPWTVKINSTHVPWKGKNIALLELLEKEKDNLVIKKSNSGQGKDVFVGRCTPFEKWVECIDNVKHDNDWIVQEFCDPEPFIATIDDPQLHLFHPIIGVFHLDNEYGGSFIRASKADKSAGVINSANGAIEFIVFEEN